MILVELSHLWQKPMKSYEIYTLFLLCLLRREEEVPPKILVLPNSQYSYKIMFGDLSANNSIASSFNFVDSKELETT